MTSNWTFLTRFLRDPMRIGAICPSSQMLARAMTHGLDLSPGETVIELGPGTGAFTECINRLLPDPNDYLGIEQDGKFVEVLNNQFPDLRFITGRAENTRQLHLNSGRNPVKIIISGVPFAGVNDDNQIKIVGELQHLMPAGSMFRTFQYLHTYFLPYSIRFRKRMDEIAPVFHRSTPILGNIPPAFVLTWII